MVVNNKKKKKNIKKYIEFIIVFFLVFLIGILIGINSMRGVSNKKDGYKRIKTIDDSRVNKLLSNLTAGNDCWNIEEYANDHRVTVKELSDERIFQVVQGSSLKDMGDSISLEDFNSELKKYFSIGYSFDPEKINSTGCNKFSYNSEDKVFVKSKIECTDMCGANRSLYKIVDVSDNGFDLKVSVKVLFGSQAESVQFYSDYERLNFVTNDYENIDNYYENGDEYLFIFLRVDDRYLFVSSEKK